MSYIGGDNVSGYKIRGGLTARREDADGRVHVYAHAGAAATSNVPKMLLIVSSVSNQALVNLGWFATAVADTGLATVTAGQWAGKTFIGIPNANIPSDTDGWFQIGGPFIGVAAASAAYAINGLVFWSDAGFGCTASFGWNYVAASEHVCNQFAISLSSVSSGTYDWYLMGIGCCGTT